jgi:hypothetical protein
LSVTTATVPAWSVTVALAVALFVALAAAVSLACAPAGVCVAFDPAVVTPQAASSRLAQSAPAKVARRTGFRMGKTSFVLGMIWV